MSNLNDDLDDLFGDTPKKEKPVPKPEPKVEQAEEKVEVKIEEKTEPETIKEVKTDIKLPPKEESAVEQPKEEVPEEDDLFGDNKKEVIKPKPVITKTATPVSKPEIKKHVSVPTVETVESGEFDLSPEVGMGKPVIVVYGKKGHGKTHLPYTLDGTFSVLCFDEKSQIIAEKFKEKDLTVYNCVRYLDKSSADQWVESSYKSWRYISKILDKIEAEDKTDWMMVDAGEIAHTMFEMVMRYHNDLRAFQGIANKNVWKHRRMLIDQLLTRCVRIAKKGVIWTAYTKDEEIIEDGDYVAKSEAPKWIDAVLYRTDTVIRVSRRTTKNGQRFYATVESSKWDKVPDSPRIDVTDSGFSKLMTGGEY